MREMTVASRREATRSLQILGSARDWGSGFRVWGLGFRVQLRKKPKQLPILFPRLPSYN